MRTPSALALALLLVASACASSRPPSRSGLEHLNAAGRTDTLPFSHGVLAGDFYFVAGTLGIDPATGKPPADVEQEVRLMLDDVKTKLALAGLGLDDLVSVQVYCPDLALYETFNRIYASYFTPGAFPARAFIGSGPLLRGCRFELQGTAARR
ncbi:MAG: RidA family protein [Planctomycetes bacterium]|nr:RidA family protein [Planctomycetota bacterium]